MYLMEDPIAFFSRADDSRGQALVEFALVAPIFFLMVFSIIGLGILFGGQNGLSLPRARRPGTRPRTA